MYKRHGVWPNGGTKKGQTMVCQRVELYRKRDSPGDPIPINVDPYEVVDGIPEDGGWRDKRQMVKDNLKRGRVGGVAQIRVEDIKNGFVVPN